MTIRHTSVALSRSTDKLSLRPLSPPRNLTREAVDRLATEITSGKLQPGARLPPEQEMMSAMGVSRTVVREAVAALRAEGLIVTRQGVGAFVAGGVLRRPFRIDPEGLRSLAEVLNVMELRLGVEVESAGLAAERASPPQLRAIPAAPTASHRAVRRRASAIAQAYALPPPTSQ